MVTGPQRHPDPRLIRLKHPKEQQGNFKFSWVLISLIPIALVVLVFFPELIPAAAIAGGVALGLRISRKKK